jgi:hypothetical protein
MLLVRENEDAAERSTRLAAFIPSYPPLGGALERGCPVRWARLLLLAVRLSHDRAG